MSKYQAWGMGTACTKAWRRKLAHPGKGKRLRIIAREDVGSDVVNRLLGLEGTPMVA